MNRSLLKPDPDPLRVPWFKRIFKTTIVGALAVALSFSALPASASQQSYDYCEEYPDDYGCYEEPEDIYSAPELLEDPNFPSPIYAGQKIPAYAGTWLNGEPDTLEWKINGVLQDVQWDDDYFGSDYPGGAPFQIPSSAVGKQLTLTVLVRDEIGNLPATTFKLGKILPNAFKSAPAPSISGTGMPGQKLTAKPGTWSPGATLKYQWKRNGVSISGATKSTYIATNADQGKSLTVTVTGTRPGYTSLTKNSAALAIKKLSFTKAPNPTIAGTAKVGERLTAKPGTWSDSPKLSYQWFRGTATIKGATGSSYITTAADHNKSLKVRVTATRSGFPTIVRNSAARKIAAGTIKPSSKLTVGGNANAGSSISASVKLPSGTKATYQWYKNGKKVSKATKKTFSLSNKDVGAKYQVRISVTRVAYSKLNMTSNTVKIAKPTFSVKSNPKISGTKKSGSTLKASVGSYSPKPTSYAYQWMRNGKSISKATKSSYKLTSTDVGKKISVRVTAKKKNYNNKSATSSAVLIPKPLKTVMSKNGTYRVGTQLKPGLYKATGSGNSCYWERLGGFSGKFSDIKANHFGSANVYVRVTSQDKGFKTQNCGSWKQVGSTGAKASTISKDGIYRVGIDIKPGLYEGRSSGSCYWETLDDFTGHFRDIRANEFTYGSIYVDITSAATGFKKSGCGTLRRVG